MTSKMNCKICPPRSAKFSEFFCFDPCVSPPVYFPVEKIRTQVMFVSRAGLGRVFFNYMRECSIDVRGRLENVETRYG